MKIKFNKETLGNRKAQSKGMRFSLNWLIQLLLLGLIMFVGYYVSRDVSAQQISTESLARDLGVAFDVLSLTANDVSIKVNCPSDAIFDIDDKKITVTSVGLSEATATYYYVHEENSYIPNARIDCSGAEFIVIRKSTNPSDLKSIISISWG